MSEANQTQVGGDHYVSEYQHWDWVHDVKLGYLEAQVTKYVSRWRKKNGLQDLQKALHFAIKLKEMYESGTFVKQMVAPAFVYDCNVRYQEAAELDDLEYRVCTIMSNWRTIHELDSCIHVIRRLIGRVESDSSS